MKFIKRFKGVSVLCTHAEYIGNRSYFYVKLKIDGALAYSGKLSVPANRDSRYNVIDTAIDYLTDGGFIRNNDGWVDSMRDTWYYDSRREYITY